MIATRFNCVVGLKKAFSLTEQALKVLNERPHENANTNLALEL